MFLVALKCKIKSDTHYIIVIYYSGNVRECKSECSYITISLQTHTEEPQTLAPNTATGVNFE